MLVDLESIRTAGFLGFLSIGDLRASNLRDVPDERGVYLVLRIGSAPPTFLERSPAGRFKGKDPTVSLNELRGNWVEGTPVVYIGKAGGPGMDATLRSRLGQYLAFGAGRHVGHRGGRYIWQLADSDNLVVCWRPTPNEVPRTVETRLIAEFKSSHIGRPPFANLKD